MSGGSRKILALVLSQWVACKADDRPARPVEEPAPVGPTTAQQLDEFWAAHGGQSSFPATYVSAVEALLYAEDEVVAGDYAAARSRIDDLFAELPLSDPRWWDGYDLEGANVGTPVAYYGLRMLDDVADVGLAPPRAAEEPLVMTVVLVSCAQGQRPTSVDLTQSEDVSLTLDPALAADDYRIVRQSLRLFSEYVWAMTEGRRTLELQFETVETCVEVGSHDGPGYQYSGVLDGTAPIADVPQEVADRTDFWWVLYPSNVPADPVFDDTAFVTGGMGGWGLSPLFIIDDLWLVRNPPHLGRGPYTDVERRVYLPQWLQHEFFHHLFRTWPEFGLEATDHQWFDRSTWPADFVGEWEPDYYPEALHKRLSTATPPPWVALKSAPESAGVVDVSPDELVAAYVRSPVENGWHQVTVSREAGQLWWNNEAGVRWSLFLEDDVLRTGADCPYGVSEVPIVGAEGVVTGLGFGGDLYERQ